MEWKRGEAESSFAASGEHRTSLESNSSAAVGGRRLTKGGPASNNES